MKILLDNGHGWDTPGKCSPDATKGLKDSPLYFREYEWNREAAQLCYNILKSKGYDVELVVPEKIDISLVERVRRVNSVCTRVGKDNVILVSVHVNAAGYGGNWMTARDWSIFTSKGTTKGDELAEAIYQEAVKEFKYPLKVRRYKDKYLERDYEENFYILAKTACPACLVENFFMDNKEDVQYLKSNQGKSSCAKVIAKGIEEYVKKNFKQ